MSGEGKNRGRRLCVEGMGNMYICLDPLALMSLTDGGALGQLLLYPHLPALDARWYLLGAPVYSCPSLASSDHFTM